MLGCASNNSNLTAVVDLQYLGRGWTFDDLSENTSISQETIRVFSHLFIEFGKYSTVHPVPLATDNV